MQKLVLGTRFEFAQETAIVLNVGKHVNRHRQIENFSFPQMIFEQREVQPCIYSSLAQFNRWAETSAPHSSQAGSSCCSDLRTSPAPQPSS